MASNSGMNVAVFGGVGVSVRVGVNVLVGVGDAVAEGVEVFVGGLEGERRSSTEQDCSKTAMKIMMIILRIIQIIPFK